jgi:hypothetical protein
MSKEENKEANKEEIKDEEIKEENKGEENIPKIIKKYSFGKYKLKKNTIKIENNNGTSIIQLNFEESNHFFIKLKNYSNVNNSLLALGFGDKKKIF